MRETHEAQKRCVICGEDCSRRPRLKDRHGRYACRACAEQRTAGAPRGTQSPPAPAATATRAPAITHASAAIRPPASAEPQDQAGSQGVYALADDPAPAVVSHATHETLALAEACPGCARRITPGQVICVQCGMNLATGKALGIKVKRSRPPPTDPSPPSVTRLTLAAGCGAIAAALALAVWISAAHAADEPMHAMVFLVGASAGAASLVPVRGFGTRLGGTVAGLAAAALCTAGLRLSPEEVTQDFTFTTAIGNQPLTMSVLALDDSARLVFGAAWVLLGAASAFALGSSNPYDPPGETEPERDEGERP